jgi:hypothetical protein
MRFDKSVMADPKFRHNAEAILDALEHQLIDELPTPDEVLKMLTTVAELFQVTLPEDDGLAIYTGILLNVPRRLMSKAVMHVCSTHKYKTMPLPADFLAAIEEDMKATQWLRLTVQTQLERLQK